MLTNLKSILTECGYLGDYENIYFKLYDLKATAINYFRGIRDYQTISSDDAHAILGQIFEMDEQHPSCYQLRAVCHGKVITLTTKYENNPLKVEIKYCDEEFLLDKETQQRFGSMAAKSLL